jgi:CheY-like chemotaxis protein
MPAAGGDNPDFAGLKVLLVDDHRDAATSLARLLQIFGCETRVCFDARSALDCVEALGPDVVILDIRLPDMPGTEVCRKLRSLETLKATTLVALTGAADAETLARIATVGFHQTLIKPVDLDSVLAVLRGATPTA